MVNKLVPFVTVIVLSMFSINANAQKVYKEGFTELTMVNPVRSFEGRCYFTADSVAVTFDMGQVILKKIYTVKNDYDAMLLDIPTAFARRAAVSTPEEIAQIDKQLPKLTFVTTTDKKVISGFNCRRVAVTNVKSGKQFDVWITNDYTLPLSGLTKFYADATGGIPIQFSTFNNNGDVAGQMIVKSVTEQKVPAGTFTIPADFDRVTMQELFNGN